MTGSEIHGTVMIGTISVAFNGEDEGVANTLLRNAINQPGNGLIYLSGVGCYSVDDDTATYDVRNPGPPINVSWDLSGQGNGNFALYNGDRVSLVASASQSTVHTIDGTQADVTGIGWDPNKDKTWSRGHTTSTFARHGRLPLP